jgi:hypothetical protein
MIQQAKIWTAWPQSTLPNAAASLCYAESAVTVYSTPHKKPAGPVAQWIRHRPTEPGIAGSSPAGVIFHAESRCACSASRSKQIKLLRSIYLNRVCVPSAHSASQLLLFRASKNKQAAFQLSGKTSLRKKWLEVDGPLNRAQKSNSPGLCAYGLRFFEPQRKK